VGADEGREVLGLHYQRLDRLKCDYSSGTNTHAQGGAFTDELTRATLGDRHFPALFMDADLRPTPQHHDYVIRLLPLLH
jgi:hypothetical protein